MEFSTKAKWTIGCLSMLIASYSSTSNAQSPPPAVSSNTAIGNGYCLVSRPVLTRDGRLFATVQHCTDPRGHGAGPAGLDEDGSISWGPIGSQCNFNTAYPWRFGIDGLSSTADGDALYATGDWNACRNGRLAKITLNGSFEWQTSGCSSSPHP